MFKIHLLTFYCIFILSCANDIIIDSSHFGSDSTLDIITWNIQNFPKEGNETIKYIEKIIDSMNVDIIAMQEIWGNDASNSFNNLLDRLDNWSGKRKSSGLAFLYHNSIEINDIYEINSLNDIIRTPYLLSVNWNKETIYIINNHFKAFGGLENERQRKIASQKIEKYINNNLNDSNVIVIGDLNDSLTDDESQNVFQNFINNDANYIFADWNIALGSSKNWSYPSWPSHIDHILITNELFDEFYNFGSEVKTINVEKYFIGGWNEYIRKVSDHRPVAIKFKFFN